ARRVGEHDDVGPDHGEQPRAFADVRDLAAVAFFLALVGPARLAREQPREMDRDIGWRERDQFRFDVRIARWNEKAEACTPYGHGPPPSWYWMSRHWIMNLPAARLSKALIS